MTRNARKTRRPSTLSACAALALLPGLQAGTHADALSAKSDHFVAAQAARPGAGAASVIVGLRGPLSSAQAARMTALGADIYRHLDLVHAVALRLPARNLGRLAALPFVGHVSADAPVRKNDEFTVEGSVADQAEQQYGVSGRGVGVAVVDSGIHSVKDLRGLLGKRILAKVSFVAGDSSTDDLCGHGTHVAGIIAGDGASSTGPRFFHTFRGIATQANLVSVRVLDAQGQGDVSTVVSGIQWVVDHKAKYNIRVLNLSVGHLPGESYTTDPLCQAAEAAWKAGIVVVCAAGNDGRLQNTSPTPTPGLDNEGFGTAYGSINSPGNDPYVITVGAMKSTDGVRADDAIATYSSRGPSRYDLELKPDIVAPGNKVISTLADGSTLGTVSANLIPLSSYAKTKDTDADSNRYFQLSGTSMATPVVSGAAALLLQADPSLSPDTVKARLMLSATKEVDATGQPDPCTYGAGYVNIAAALASNVTTTQYALSPQLVTDGQNNVYVTFDHVLWGDHCLWGTNISDLNILWGDHCLWGTTILWGDHCLWGTTALWGTHCLWGTTILWGDSTLNGSTCIWGKNVLWGDHAVWGAGGGAQADTILWGDHCLWGTAAAQGSHCLWGVNFSSTVLNGE